MPNTNLAKSCGAVTLAVGMALAATPACAGFQWVAPSDGATYQQPAPVSSYAMPPSAATDAPEIISPVVISGDTRPAAALPMISPAAPATNSAPVFSAEKPMFGSDLSTATISVSPSVSGGDKVQGFASQIPLALALRQILPTGYNFSIDQDVSMDTLVSYKGGKGWRETLHDALVPVGLVDREQGSSVTISHAAAASGTDHEGPVLSDSTKPATSAPSFLAVAPPADMPAVNVNAADGWTAARGDTLHKVLTDWCRRSNVELQWLAEYDYPVEASAHFNGSFEDAVRGLLAGFDGARPQPVGELHTNPSAGQMVLVVQARGNSYSN